MDFYSASSLKQQSAGRHVAPLGHIILIPTQPVFALSPKCCVLSGEATNISFIVFGLTTPGLKPTPPMSFKFCRTFYFIYNAYLQYKATLKKIYLSCGHFTLQDFD